MSTHHAFDIIL